MFGGNIQSSWANPQQNQPQQQPSAFGQPAFGSGFGSTSTFGQGTQQQPTTNPMFGNLGASTSTSTGTTGFGAFGSNAGQNASAFGAFGAPKPATGFGAFGGGGGGGAGAGAGGSTFGGTGFGQPSTSHTGTGTSIFGQPSTTTSAFGTGASLFGSKPASTFGTTGTATTQATPPVVTTGTSNPPYQPHPDKDATSSITLQYQGISCIPAYSGYSFEELRLQDYAQGRKTASTFGTSTFGGTQPTTGAFGSQTMQPSAFGSTTAAPSTGFSAFGQPAGTGTTGGGNLGFGSQPQPQQQQQQQPAQTGFGAFGSQTQPQQQTGGAFGGPGAFGAAANKPAFGAFGGGGGFGAFGQQTQQQQQPSQQGSIFGNTQPSTGIGAFGSTANKPNLFGTTQTTQPSGFGGAFGAQQQQQQPQGQQTSAFGPGTSLFNGGNQQQQQQQQGAQQTGSIFGSSTTQPAGTGFGGGSIFSQQQPQQQPQQQTGGFGSLFGSKPAATTQAGGGLFSNFGQQNASTATNPGLFGNTLGQTGQSALGGGLFGRPAAPALGTVPSTGQNGGGIFGSLNTHPNGLNATFSAPGTQATLTASISQPIVSSDLPLSSLLPSGPRLINLDQAQPKKKAGFFVDVPTRSPVPRVQLGYTPASSKLRGFTASTLSSAANGNPFTASLSLTSGKPGALTISKAMDSKNAAPGDSFIRSSSPSLGSGTRQSIKKVVLDKKIDPAQIFAKSGSPGLLKGGKVTFSPALSVAVREKDAVAAALPPPQSITPIPTPPHAQRTPNKFTANISKDGSQADDVDTDALDEGDYYVKPPLPTLKKLGYDELSAFKGLVVGRVGYGEIEFLDPVDLTGLPKLSALLGEVIRFEDKECSVYPDSEEVDKPPPSSGLNTKAKITLVRCWAVDKATREPIKDSSHPAATKHLKRLQSMKDTQFENFDIEEGKWTFAVDHF